METSSKFVKVRIEEIGIGVALGVGTGLAVSSPLTMGLPSLNPLSAAIGMLGFFQACALWGCAIAGGCIGGWWAARQERDSHVSGHLYLRDFTEAAAALQAQQSASFSAAQRAGTVHGITVGGVELARSQEVRHFVIVGKSGAGKSAFLTSVIDQALARGDRVLLHDPSGDFTKSYFDPKTAVLLGPWDERANMWDGASDINDPALANEFGSAIAGTVEGGNSYFYESAGRLMSGLIRSYMEDGKAWTWGDLWEPLTGDPVSLVQRAARGNPLVKMSFATVFPPPTSTAQPRVEKGGIDVMATLAQKVEWLAQIAAVDRARPGAPRFSIVKWLLGAAHQEIKMVLLNTNARYSKAAQALFGTVLKSMVAVASSAEMPGHSPDDGAATWCLFDELPMLAGGAMESAQQLAALARKKGMRVMIAVQDETQLAAEVGEAKAKPMVAVQGGRIFMECSEETAKAVSDRIGEREVNRIETTSENGALSGKQKKLVTQRVLPPSELTGLRARKDAPLGVELVLHVGATLGRLLHPYAERHPDIAEDYAASEAWRFGTLERWQREHGLASKTESPEVEEAPQPTPPAGGIDPADLPFDPPKSRDPLDI